VLPWDLQANNDSNKEGHSSNRKNTHFLGFYKPIMIQMRNVIPAIVEARASLSFAT